jgi:hypothetical protein
MSAASNDFFDRMMAAGGVRRRRPATQREPLFG